MPKKIDPNFKPHPRVYELLANRFSITIESAREFCGHQIGVFKLHFETRDDAQAKKSNWNTTFYNWMLKAFEDQKEQVALHRQAVPTQGNIFEEALGGVYAQDLSKPTERRRVYHKPKPPPAPTETMSEADALDALAKFSKKAGAR